MQTANVLRWFAESGRDLPWRRTRDPWTILLCELMSQQTQVSRVVERLPGFLVSFPNPTAMANGPSGAVIEAWTGLGYNRRAVNLHRAATQIRDSHDGCVPSNRAELQNLPGIGPYTARAIRVFAFEYPDAVVDTNIARVLARHQGRSLTTREVQALADELVPVEDPWTWNQALMEVGALRCRRIPQCGVCPLEMECSWASKQRQEPDPAKNSAKVSSKQSTFAGSDRQGRGALVRALGGGPVPSVELANVMGWPDDMQRARRVAKRVVADGLATEENAVFTLPGGQANDQ